jgi:hypothetical protein
MPRLSIRYNRTSTNGNPGTYIAIESQWKDGDTISFKLHMDFRMTKYSGEDKVYQEHYALEFRIYAKF